MTRLAGEHPGFRHRPRRACALRGICVAALALLAAACAPHRDIPGPTPPDVETPAPPSPPGPPDPLPRAVFIIHGDADYLYHDAEGARKRADEEALRAAREAAMRPDAGEVFVFHQRTGAWRKLAGTRGGTFEHYRAGVLINKTTYRRRDAGFGAEAALLRSHVGNTPSPLRLRLAYFGHEIAIPPASPLPAHDGEAGSIEDPSRALDLAGFTDGLRRIAESFGTPLPGDTAQSSARPYELVVLSTCYGGTPATIRGLAPFVEYVVASPAYLHLSYLDARALALTRVEEPKALADTIAHASFRRLQDHTSTEITVAVYDVRATSPPPDTAFARRKDEGRPVPSPEIAEVPGGTNAQWDDCARADTALLGGVGSRGVNLHYQPPRFGAHKNRNTRSAWQCLF